MSLLVLGEFSAGYALFKAKDKKLLKRDDIAEQTRTPEATSHVLKLKHFSKYDSAATAVEEARNIGDGKVTPMLSKLLDSIKDEHKASLAVADPKLASAIAKLPQLKITPVADSTTEDLFRAVREHATSLIPGLTEADVSKMSLGLSHSMSRAKLKFSPEKVDTMIIQAINLLDDLDKELNTYAMRVREWYGWHFPEMAKIINDNHAYARVILKMGYRTDASKTDLAEILPEELEVAVKNAAEVSMGTEITAEDLEHIQALAMQVDDFTEYRKQLSDYLSARMQSIAPNLTVLVGDLVGARLIAHSGSLMNLAKSPASTIQILGAEKALFRALKTKHDTPKYGLIYHASLVGQATGKNKGKIARMLAAKTALGLRQDAVADWGVNGQHAEEEPTEEDKVQISQLNRIKLERKLRFLEGKPLGPRAGTAIGPNGQKQSQPDKFNIKEARKYNPDADGLAANAAPRKVADAKIAEVEDDDDEDMDDAEDESVEDEEAARPALNGATDALTAKADKKAQKALHKIEKAQRKAERAAKREKKAAKKAAKEAKNAGLNGDEGGKKRKHSTADAADAPEKSKKKKHKST